MTVGAFAVLELAGRRGDDRHGLDDYRGLALRRPVLGGLLAFFVLAQAGVPFISVHAEIFGKYGHSYDMHENNFGMLKNVNLPILDQGYSALIEDLESRGLLDSTLVIVMGEMGRTPKINKDGGRDHWTFCYSVLLAGAGLRGGSVCGASDAHAAYIKDRPVHIRDICATIYHCLGIDPEMPVFDHGRKPIPIAHGGRVLTEIVI